jgi:adenosylcobinamide-GDP ribazoletransferase
MMGEISSAWRFLTILPAPAAERGPFFGASAFPVVGLLVGAGAAGFDVAIGWVSPILRDAGVVAFLAVVSGGLHHDGLADTFDALGGRTVPDRLRILQDEHKGTFGVVALIVGVAVKLAALSALGGGARVRALILAPAIARWTLVLAGWRARPARKDGLGAAFAGAVRGRQVILASIVAIPAAAALAGSAAIVVLSVAIAAVAALRALARSRFGGMTGDVIGACGEVVETLVLAVLAGAPGASL